MNDQDLVVEEAPAPTAPPPPTDQTAAPMYVMAHGEQFTREQYHASGWTDPQLLLAGKMTTVEMQSPARIDLAAPLGLPDSTWIILDDNDDIPPTGLFVGHNGIGFLIQTGIPVNVPNHVIGVIDDSVMSAPIINPADRKVMGYRDRPRYTYRRVSAPADA